MRVNLIPMAGEGQRYVDAGYQIPKPFIEVDGLPMVIRACQALPLADRYIFVCRKSHLEKYPMEEKIKEYIPNAIIVSVDHLTEGQAITCLAARDYIPDDAILTIGASDNDMTFSSSEMERLFLDEEVDGWIWTFRNNPAVLQNPKMYGWVETFQDSVRAKRVLCKIPLSEKPMNDHAVIGAFTFKKAKYFFEAVEAMVRANERINHEFYVDVAADFAIRAGLNIQACEVDQYICWGTPQDYTTYQYWLEYFKRRIIPKMKKLSIVIPCYNESGSLPNLVQVCREACGAREDVEFIFVDNGSSDGTQEIFKKLLAKPENAFAHLMHVPINQGYGYGILQGLSLAQGEVLAWTHADLQTDPKDVIIAFDQFGTHLASGQMMVKGERNGRGLFDVFFTASMSVISSFLLGSKLWDVNAQPKMFHRSFMKHLDVAPYDFSLDLYVLFVANRLGMKIQSFPVFFAKREFGEAKGGGSLKGKYKLIKRTFAYIFQLRNDIKQGKR